MSPDPCYTAWAEFRLPSIISISIFKVSVSRKWSSGPLLLFDSLLQFMPSTSFFSIDPPTINSKACFQFGSVDKRGGVGHE